jgi:chromosomal replication initiator protein
VINTEKAEATWKKVLEFLSGELSSVTMAAFFEGTKGIDITADNLVVDAGNIVSRDSIKGNHIDNIERYLFNKYASPYKCILLAGEKEVGEYISRNKEETPFLLTDEFTFNTFVVGNSNRFANAAALAVANEASQSYNPLFIHGGSGLGKTHLLYAIAHELRRKNPDMKIIYLKGDEFTIELIDAIRTGKNFEFREKYRMADLFLVDDIQFIAGKESTQEEFFHTFNTLYEAGKQIVVTSDRPPKEMTRLADRVKSRFEGGLICDIQPPDLETRMAIIRNKANALHIEISDAAVMFMAENITANVRQIEGVVKKLQAYNILLGEEIDIEAVSKAIKDIFIENPGLNPTPSIIIEETERFYDLDQGAIAGKKRDGKIAQARHVAVYLIRTMTKLSFPDIGKALNRHHTTIMHSVEQIEHERKIDQRMDSEIKDITFNITNRQ